MSLFFAFFLSVISIIVAFRVHDKYDPARYFLLLWGVQIILIPFFFYKYFSFTGGGLLFIAIACLTFSLGTNVGKALTFYMPQKNCLHVFMAKPALSYLQICVILSFFNVAHGIYAQGFNLSQIFFFDTLLEMNNAISVARYTVGKETNLYSQVSLIFVYLSPLYGGYLLPLLPGKKKIWCYITILPALTITLTQAVKAGFIASIFLFMSGIITSSYANNRIFFKTSAKTIFRTIFYFALSILILFISMTFRTGKFEKHTVIVIKEKFINYTLGHLPAFDIWFSENSEIIMPTYGIKTFYGISNFIGIAKRSKGVFSESTIYGKNDFDGMSTNVYTVFRFLLEDFGLFGSLFALFVSGIISGYAWMMIKKRSNFRLSQTILIAALFFIFYSFIAPVWAYTSFILTIALFCFLLILVFKKTRARQYA